MPNFAVTTPVVNGNHYSFASVELDIDGLLFADVTAIDYADPVKPGLIYGTGGTLIGRTPGISKPTLSITLTRRCWDALRAQLSDGSETYGTKSFIVRVSYFEAKLPGENTLDAQLISDIIEGVRVVGPSVKNAQGNAASMVTLDTSVFKIKWGRNEVRDGSTAIADDGPGSTVKETDPRLHGTNVPQGSATWWSSSDDGFEAAGDGVHAPNSWDTFSVGGIQLPGKCVVTASRPPSRAIEEQKPNGSDAAAMIDRGYLQATIEVDVTLWMRGHFSAWEGVIRDLWQTPGKASKFEEPIPQAAPSTGPATKDQQKAQVARANAPILRERAAIEAGRTAAKQRALEIYHPALAPLGITTALIESPGVLVAGPEPQTFVSKMKLRQYLPASAGVRHVVRKTAGSAKKDHQIVPPLAGSGQNFTPSNQNFTPAATEGNPT